ncbi:GNAT family N-acetyltransferase [Nonomuraea rhizosphaerae]|uniref:GNAT family N-acetyltransferase n=1 Tax=Nonomuraea rhizosphaerae TaxID=2665663 RepID=UPI001C5DD382|nr:GNAT family N-acetyltransferase [Nonomuraea rhizosphaerae]
MPDLIPTRATPDDTPRILELLDNAAAWLHRRGITAQWSIGGFPTERIISDIRDGHVYVVRHDTSLVAAVTIDRRADPELWQPDDNPDRAVYVHRLVVRRSWAGRRIGALLLDFAAECAAAAGLPLVRVDCAKGNTDLHRYYTSMGFSHVRTVDLPHRRSGALFQRATCGDRTAPALTTDLKAGVTLSANLSRR